MQEIAHGLLVLCIQIQSRKKILGIFTLKVIWSFGKGSEIFQENSHLIDFHLKAYYAMHTYMKIIHMKCA